MTTNPPSVLLSLGLLLSLLDCWPHSTCCFFFFQITHRRTWYFVLFAFGALEFRHSRIQAHQIDMHRFSYINALLIQTQGVCLPEPCTKRDDHSKSIKYPATDDREWSEWYIREILLKLLHALSVTDSKVTIHNLFSAPSNRRLREMEEKWEDFTQKERAKIK